MIWLIWPLVGLVYMAGWIPTAVLAARYFGHQPYCHSEAGYNWPYKDYCHRNCPKGCWRPGDVITPLAAAKGSGVAVAWPLVMFPALVWLIGQRSSKRALLTGDALASLERAAGIR